MVEIKWERNSRALSLASHGKIASEDIIPRMKTAEFPAETATVRVQRLSDKTPSVTLHIRGKSIQRKLWDGSIYECANTCRVNIANDWKTGTMSSSGELDENYSWQDVHDIVERVKKALKD